MRLGISFALQLESGEELKLINKKAWILPMEFRLIMKLGYCAAREIKFLD